jgi:hypothetical protein
MAQLARTPVRKFCVADAAVLLYASLFFVWSWFQPKP